MVSPDFAEATAAEFNPLLLILRKALPFWHPRVKSIRPDGEGKKSGLWVGNPLLSAHDHDTLTIS